MYHVRPRRSIFSIYSHSSFPHHSPLDFVLLTPFKSSFASKVDFSWKYFFLFYYITLCGPLALCFALSISFAFSCWINCLFVPPSFFPFPERKWERMDYLLMVWYKMRGVAHRSWYGHCWQPFWSSAVLPRVSSVDSRVVSTVRLNNRNQWRRCRIGFRGWAIVFLLYGTT